MPMLQLAVAAALAVLTACAPAADCAAGAGECAVGADHALLQAKSEIRTSKKLAAEEPPTTGAPPAEIPVADAGKKHRWHVHGSGLNADDAAIPVTTTSTPVKNIYGFTGGVPPVSVTMKCVISVTVLYFVIWTSLFFVTSLKGQKHELSLILEEATQTVQYAPMISLLFIATRMRAIAVTSGDTEKWGGSYPQYWCKDAMEVSAACVVILTLLCIAERTMPEEAMGVLSVLQYVADAALYAGFAVVGYGLYSMDAPPGLGITIPISDTAKCIAILTLSYFAVQIVHQLAETVDLFRTKGKGGAPEDKDEPLTKNTKAVLKATKAVLKAMDLAPMVCILFLAARMRALQIGLDAPQPWARHFFFGATYAILGLAVLEAVASRFDHPIRSVSALQGITLAALYVSIAVAIDSVFAIAAPAGLETPGISTTVRIVMGLAVMYFFVYAGLFVAEQIQAWEEWSSSTAVELFKAARATVMFCPMLCALFVGVRMRALQLTHNKGAPQGWAQDCMILAAWAISLDLVAVVLQHLEVFSSNFSTFFSSVCLFLLHSSVVAVIVSLFLQTPENANSSGGLIPGFRFPGRM